MPLRHYAWFDSTTGAYLDDRILDVPLPDIAHSLVGEARQQALNEWQQAMVGLPRTACLDVTQFAYPEGDFVRARFDLVDRALLWDDDALRCYAQVNRALRLYCYVTSHRPIRSTPERLVLDVSGTVLEQQFLAGNALFGHFAKLDGKWTFTAQDANEPLALPSGVLQQLWEPTVCGISK